MNVPNLLSVARVFLLPPVLYLMSQQNHLAELVIITAAMALSDALDGFLARRLNQVSDAGKVLDPIADKACIVGIGVGLILYRDFPLWAFVLIVLRDVIILAVGLLVIRRSKNIPVSNVPGKVTVITLAVCMAAYMLRLDAIKEILLYAGLVMLCVSLISYYRNIVIPAWRKT